MLAWTLEALAASPVVARIVVVASAANIDEISGAPWVPDRVSRVVPGGDRRQRRWRRAWRRCGRGPTVRPTLAPTGWSSSTTVLARSSRGALIEAVARAAERHGAAIPVVPVAETVKRVAGELVAETVDRSDLVTAQTPQGVRAGLLARAYEQFPPDGPETWTDEAALLEACRIPVHVVPGDPDNIKVTQPADLRRVESMVAGRAGAARRHRSRQPSVRARDPAGARRDRHRWRAAPVRPLRWRRRPPRARRRAARGRRPGRSRPALPGRQPDAARHRQHGAAGRGPGSGGGRRLATGRRRPDDRRRPAALGRAPRTDARRDRGTASASSGTRSTSRRRAGTSTAPRAPAAGSPRWSWRRWRWRRDGPPARHAVGRDPAAGPAARRPDRHLLVRPDRLRAGPHRQLPLVPVRRPAGALPQVARRAGDLGHEHHRHRRQDHPRCGRDRRVDRDPRGALPRRVPGRRRGAPDDDAGRAAEGDPPHRRDRRADRARSSSGATPTGPTTARSSTGSRRGRRTGAWRASIPRASGWGSGSSPTSTARTTSATSRCGRHPSPASRRGRPRSDRAGRAGTSNARR